MGSQKWWEFHRLWEEGYNVFRLKGYSKKKNEIMNKEWEAQKWQIHCKPKFERNGWKFLGAF